MWKGRLETISWRDESRRLLEHLNRRVTNWCKQHGIIRSRGRVRPAGQCGNSVSASAVKDHDDSFETAAHLLTATPDRCRTLVPSKQLTGPKRPLWSPELQSKGFRIAEREICIKDVALTKSQQPADEILFTRSEISEDNCRHIVGSEPNNNEGGSKVQADGNKVHRSAKRQKHKSD